MNRIKFKKTTSHILTGIQDNLILGTLKIQK